MSSATQFKPQNVGNIFGYVQQEQTVFKKHVQDLLNYLWTDPQKLSYAFQQSHLKIMKSMDKVRNFHRKDLEIFEKLTTQ